MFVPKVEDHKKELVRSLFRNFYLKHKSSRLDKECKLMAEQVLESQVAKADKNDQNNDLQELQQACEEQTTELLAKQQQIKSLLTALESTQSSTRDSLNECQNVNDELEVKDDMIVCLQEQLVRLRLQDAEKWALVRELKEKKDELENDKKILNEDKPETIAILQEELMGYKFKEAQHANEFRNIKDCLGRLKSEVAAHKKTLGPNDEPLEGSVKFSMKGVFWKTGDKNNVSLNEVQKNIATLEKERSGLLNQLPALQHKVDVLNRQAELKEEERLQLEKQLDDVRIKLRSLEDMAKERRRQYGHLEDRASEKVGSIKESCEEKKGDVDMLVDKLDRVSSRRESYTTIVKLKEAQLIRELEDQIATLNERILELKQEET